MSAPRAHAWLIAVAALLLALPLAAQRHDPLTALEADELREASLAPNERIKLFVKYTRLRMDLVTQFAANPDGKQAGQKLHDLIEDVCTLTDQVSDNVEEYAGRKHDVRKALKDVMAAFSEFQAKLGALKETSSTDPKLKPLYGDYQFILQDVIESVNGGLIDARKTMEDQNVHAKDLIKTEIHDAPAH